MRLRGPKDSILLARQMHSYKQKFNDEPLADKMCIRNWVPKQSQPQQHEQKQKQKQKQKQNERRWSDRNKL